MSRFFDLVSKPAREMGDYLPAPPAKRAAADGRPQLIKLDSNENPFGPSPRAIQRCSRSLPGGRLYPDDDCTELRRKLAAHHDMPAEQVLVTAGSTALLGLLCQTMLAPGLNASDQRTVVHCVCDGGARRRSAVDRDSDARRWIRSGRDSGGNQRDTRLMFLANPNNPTGTMLDAAVVDEFIAEVPGHVVVVLDEAYYEFAMHFAARARSSIRDRCITCGRARALLC
jgi:histidinol-phosphate aminotransferase